MQLAAYIGDLEDTMESFFLSETAMYLFLLWSDAAALPHFYVFSTEGHLMPPIHDAPPPTGAQFSSV
jgi:hypothetical protein